MTTIFKYELPVMDYVEIKMPKYARILSVQVQREQICVWAEVNPDRPQVPHAFWIRGTGHLMGEIAQGTFLGTVQLQGGALVFHVFGGRSK